MIFFLDMLCRLDWYDVIPCFQAYDLVDPSPAIVSTNRPGDYFTVIGSPHKVVYIASNSAGLSVTCSFEVIVAFQPVAFNAYIYVDNSSIIHTSESDGLGTIAFHDLLFDASIPRSFSFDSTIYTAININIQADDLAELAFRRLDPTVSAVLFSFDIILTVASSTWNMSNARPSFASMQFLDPVGANGPLLFTENWLRKSLVTVIDDNKFIRISGFTDNLVEPFSFRSLIVTLNVPNTSPIG